MPSCQDPHSIFMPALFVVLGPLPEGLLYLPAGHLQVSLLGSCGSSAWAGRTRERSLGVASRSG